MRVCKKEQTSPKPCMRSRPLQIIIAGPAEQNTCISHDGEIPNRTYARIHL